MCYIKIPTVRFTDLVRSDPQGGIPPLYSVSRILLDPILSWESPTLHMF